MSLAARGVADELAGRTGDVVGAAAIAVILHGSLASGDFAPPRSDIDLLVVVGGSLTNGQRSALAEAVTSVAQRRQVWLDFRVVTSTSARRPQWQPLMELYVGLHPDLAVGVEVKRGPTPEPDLLIEFSMCREHGIALVGPSSRELIGPVPLEWVLEVGDQCLERWQQIDYEERTADLMVVTACRLWRLHDEARHCSKSEAAAWASARDPDLSAPRKALQRRTSGSTTPLPQADVMALIATVRGILAGPP